MTASAPVPIEVRCGCPRHNGEGHYLPLRRYPENLARLLEAAPALAELGYLELFTYRCPKCKRVIDVTLGALLGAV